VLPGGYQPRKFMNLRGKPLIDNLCHSEHNRIYSRYSPRQQEPMTATW